MDSYGIVAPARVIAAPVDNDMIRFDIAAVIDDREESVAIGDEFTDAWQEWSRISNIVAVRAPGSRVELTTISAVLSDSGMGDAGDAVGEHAADRLSSLPGSDYEAAPSTVGVDYAAVSGGGVPLSKEWNELLSQQSLLSAKELKFARDLAEAGVEEVPVWGEETDEGVSLDFAWPERS